MAAGERAGVDKAYYYEQGKEAARAWRVIALRQAFDLALKFCSMEGYNDQNFVWWEQGWRDAILEKSDILEFGDHAQEETGNMTVHVPECVAAVRVLVSELDGREG